MEQFKILEHELVLSILHKIEKSTENIQNPFTENINLYKNHIDLLIQAMSLLSKTILITKKDTECNKFQCLEYQVQLLQQLI